MSVYDTLTSFGVVPVIRIDRAEDAVPLARALQEGGLPCAEITFRTAAAEDAIRRICAELPGFFTAAGTVLTPEQADRAAGAGAGLIVSPGTNPAVVEHCLQKGLPVVPGVCTPTEIEAALAFGLDHLKFFPAEAMGGVKTVRALAAPYVGVKFMPTGGVSAANLADYLSLKPVFCCGGSFMVPPDLINAGRFDEIRKLTADAVSIVKEVRK